MDHGQQRRPRHHLHEARIQPGLPRKLHDARAEQVVAHRTAPAGRHAKRGRHPCHVPAGAAGDAAPAVLASADQVGQGFAEYGETWQVSIGQQFLYVPRVHTESFRFEFATYTRRGNGVMALAGMSDGEVDSRLSTAGATSDPDEFPVAEQSLLVPA